MGPPTRQRDLFPLPLPFRKHASDPAPGLSRCSVRRLHAREAWQNWANAGVVSLNQLNNSNRLCKSAPSSAQAAALDQFCKLYKDMGKPPSMTPAGAFAELCHQSVPYATECGGPSPYDRDLIS